MFALEFLSLVLLSALAAAFVLSLARKWGLVEWLQVHGNGFFSQMAHCSFCLSWWACVALSLAFAAAMGEWLFVLVPFFSTVVTKKLL